MAEQNRTSMGGNRIINKQYSGTCTNNIYYAEYFVVGQQGTVHKDDGTLECKSPGLKPRTG